MNRLPATLLACALLPSQPAAAQGLDSMPATPEANIIEELPPGDDDDLRTPAEIAHSRPSEPSALLRRGKSAYLLAAAGWSVLPLAGTGGAAGYLVTPNLGIEAAYDSARLNFFALHAAAQVTTVRARRFWGNSFCTNFGFAERSLSVSYAPGGASMSAEAQRRELALETSAGNLWQWRTVSFGIDWAGVLMPLKRLSNTDDFGRISLPDDMRHEKTSIYDQLASGPTYMVGKIWLGFAL